MKKLICSTVLLSSFLLLFFVDIQLAIAETDNYSSRKIRLGNFKIQKGVPVSGTHSVRWWDLDPFQVAVDDKNHIYVLDIYGKKVLEFAPDGKLIKEIMLKDISFPYKNRNIDDGYLDYMIQVSSDGSYIYVPNGSEEYKWTILDDNGTPIKKNITIFTLFNRVCNQFLTDGEVLDTNLNIVKQVTKHVYGGEILDSMLNFYSIKPILKDKKPLLIKRNADRREIWKIELSNYNKIARLLGVDGEDNVYVLTEGPYGIAKVNKEGRVVANISLSKDSLFTSGKFKNGIFRILCDGSIYYFPPPAKLSEKLNNLTEYSIYKFERLKAVK